MSRINISGPLGTLSSRAPTPKLIPNMCINVWGGGFAPTSSFSNSMPAVLKVFNFCLIFTFTFNHVMSLKGIPGDFLEKVGVVFIV